MRTIASPNENAALLVISYIDEYLFEPNARWPEPIFANRSISRWVGNQIIDLVLHGPFTPQEEIEKFINKLDSCVENTENKDKKFMLLTAIDAARDILTLFN